MIFQGNMCPIDRVMRLLIGCALLYVGFIDPGLIGISSQMLGIVLGIIGLVNIGASFLGFCPVYSIAGISSCRSSDANKD